MARIKNGIAGGFSGKVGAVIGYQVRGKNYIWSVAKPTSKLPISSSWLPASVFG